MDFIYKLRKLCFLFAISLILFGCSVTGNYQASADVSSSVSSSVSSEQLAINIKKDIDQNPNYQKGNGHYQAKKYTRYVNRLVEQVKQKKISEKDARNLLIKTYRQFKTKKYNFEKENMFYESPPVTPTEDSTVLIPRYIPPKPGAL